LLPPFSIRAHPPLPLKQVEDIRECLDIERVVSPSSNAKLYILGVYRIAVDKLQVVRTQQANYRQAVRTLLVKHEDAVPVLEYSPTANSVNILVRFKEYVMRNKIPGIVARYQTVTWMAPASEEQVLDLFRQIYDERTAVDALEDISVSAQVAAGKLGNALNTKEAPSQIKCPLR
jgi:hypothetical protein